MPSIHTEVTTRHEATRITDQKYRRTAILLGLGQPTQHVLLGPVVAAIGELHEQIFDHRGDDVSGGDGVDADGVLTPLGGQVASELDDSCFGGVVGWADESLYKQGRQVSVFCLSKKSGETGESSCR
jgi:hypothetical protein